MREHGFATRRCSPHEQAKPAGQRPPAVATWRTGPPLLERSFPAAGGSPLPSGNVSGLSSTLSLATQPTLGEVSTSLATARNATLSASPARRSPDPPRAKNRQFAHVYTTRPRKAAPPARPPRRRGG